MSFLLSIRIVFPRRRGRVWYDDQRHVHQRIFAGEEVLDYAFMGTDPAAPDDVWLREAAERQIAFICFLGVSRRPGPARAAAQ
jgi:putative restriction endonuclease